MLKLIGGIGFALIYTFYYTYGGDTVTYFKDAANLNRLMVADFGDYISYVVGDLGEQDLRYEQGLHTFFHHKGTSEFFVTRFTSIFSFLGLGNFYTTTLFFAFLSFTGVWLMFLVFVRRYPEVKFKMGFAVLFIPSVFFWGSGLMKDSVTIGFLGVLLYYLDKMKRNEGYKVMNVLAILVSCYVIFNVKAYVLMSFLPAAIIWFMMEYLERIKNPVVKSLALPFFLVMSAVGVYSSIVALGAYNDDYAIESVFKKAKGMQTWHYQEGNNTSEQFGRGSSYTIGDYEESYAGLASVFPAAVNVTLFRPYITEVGNPMMLFSALESLAILLATIYIFLGLGFFKVLKYLYNDSFLLMCFVFAIFFAFAVGFTSYNFGALVRYNIPCIPFFVATLFILERRAKDGRKIKTNRNRPMMSGSVEK